MSFTSAYNDHLDPDRHNTPARRTKTMSNEWVLFTKRTEDPKLAWLQKELAENGIESRRGGYSWHAPILEVKQGDLDAAWEILTPVDDVEDDDPRFL